MEDTIFALATAEGKAGVAVIRLSGPDSVAILERLGGRAPEARRASVQRLTDDGGALLDEALVLRFDEGASFTGEAVVELHLHGSIAIIRAVLDAIARTGLARLARPGEFTRRALMNDRMDLLQVQGLGDLIDAETEAQRREAMRVYTGEISARVTGWRDRLIRARALTEATIDFADEEVPEDVSPEVTAILAQLLSEIDAELAGVRAAKRIRSGFTVALVGPPNAGKSSLINALTRSDAAIVSDIAGTTRDVIEVRTDLRGLAVTFLDTAGIRETADRIEQLGVERARQRASAADLRIFLAGDGADELGLPEQPGDLRIRTRADIDPRGTISTKTMAGIDALLDSVHARLAEQSADAGLITRERDRAALNEARQRIATVLENSAIEAELVAAELQAAADTLRAIIGGVDIEAILDDIFASFCIGK
ncbi:tRNA uridine-5-carboxymethylaminomethyl(34) synthesis GTPase MnmE [Jannaschia ovalis]|uniref:tRNA modification GTPase MnmE n=1 Tax=Jannaschia ovalis TaxID=3038773 RepID=A0ABY8LJH5_9RHOB|nr:tRNA uridine-5-carboxymethylaminomethyl(34) synthesis GTPase MnmE [Jannaschia sp. GRR-S6-38]WGH80293.1 tRNA uridine-5-carboxymethylaminomethyl(34) synthesis GTPase MnmE [Jannaschia sp. GRR-S6-38]